MQIDVIMVIMLFVDYICVLTSVCMQIDVIMLCVDYTCLLTCVCMQIDVIILCVGYTHGRNNRIPSLGGNRGYQGIK